MADTHTIKADTKTNSDNTPNDKTFNSNNTPNNDNDGRAIPLNFIGHSLLLLFAVLVLAGLVHSYWYGENGQYAIRSIQDELAYQQQINAAQLQKNNRLKADIADLKSGVIAIEEHARVDLGLIKPQEIFVQLSTAPVAHQDIPNTSNEPDAQEVLDIMVEDTP